MVRNTLIAAYILLVLTVAAVARANTGIASTDIKGLPLPSLESFSVRYERMYAASCVPNQDPLREYFDAPPCVHHEVISERDVIRRLREVMRTQEAPVLGQGTIQASDDSRVFFRADNGTVVELVSDEDLSDWHGARVVIEGFLMSMDTPPSASAQVGAPLLRQPSLNGVQALYVTGISEVN